MRIKVEDMEGFLWLFPTKASDRDRVTLMHVETGGLLRFIDKFGPIAWFR